MKMVDGTVLIYSFRNCLNYEEREKELTNS